VSTGGAGADETTKGNTMNTTEITYKQGDVVAYEDCANYEIYVVVRHEGGRNYDQYVLCNTHTCWISRSDLRSSKWKLVNA
jgi:hypothetical protein